MYFDFIVNCSEIFLVVIAVFCILFNVMMRFYESKYADDNTIKIKIKRFNEGRYAAGMMNYEKDVKWLRQQNHGSFRDFLSKRIKRSKMCKTDSYEIPFKEGV